MALPTNISPKKLRELTTKLNAFGIKASETELATYGTLLERMMGEFGNELTQELKDSAYKKGNYTQGMDSGLINSIHYEISQMGDAVRMDIKLDDYYSYVDEGISGTKVTRNGRVRSSKRTPVEPFIHYIINKPNALAKGLLRNPSLKGLPQKVQVQRLAYLMSLNIYKYGFQGSNFYSEVINKPNMDEFAKKFTEITGKAIVFTIKK